MRTSSRLATATVLFIGVLIGWLGALVRLSDAFAQDRKSADSQSARDHAGTPLVLPQPDFEFKGRVGRTILDSDKPQFPQPAQALEGAPNVVMILLDDTGFGQYSTFGGAIPSPTIQKLADEGLRYNRFHTTALCSPTRAALITGRNHHTAATGIITEAATGYDGYTCVLPRSCGTVGEVLRQNGYMTAWIGKNHNTPAWETSAAGPFDRWANGLGFDYFFGFNAGDMNHWNPILFENRNLVPAATDPNYHLTPDLADKAISWVRKVKSIAPEKPYFLYVAPGANHSPHHAPREWIDKFKGQFDGGWDKYREETLERQKKLGVVPQNTKLTARSEGLPAWDGLSADEKRIYARMMEVFAGYAAHCDHEMGRIIDAVKQMPGAENTIIIYIVGDNGASAEGGIEGSINENLFFNGFPEKWQDNLKHIDDLGGPKFFNHFPSAWAHAMCTPFQWTKQVASHFGGTRNPMVISWPAKIKDKGGLRSQFVHTIDVVPTLYEVIGITPPRVLNGIQQKPVEGISFAYTFHDASAKGRRSTQYFELGAQARNLPGRMVRVVAFVRPVDLVARGIRPRQGQVGALQHRRRFFAGGRPGEGIPAQIAPTARLVVGGSGQAQRAAARLARHGTAERRAAGPAELGRQRQDDDVLPRSDRTPERGIAAHAQQVVDHHGRRRLARERRGHDRHARRDARRVRPVPARRQADVRVQLPRPRPPHVCRHGATAQGQDATRGRICV